MRILDFGLWILDCGSGGGRSARAQGTTPAGGPPLAASQASRRVVRRSHVLALLTAALLGPGCIAGGRSRPPEQRVTYVAKQQSEPAYYLNQAPAAAATGTDFDKLWQAMYRATRNAGYRPDREDYRLGVLSTRPLVSAQIFEPWQRDAGSLYGVLESTLATVRRTVRWEVTRGDDGTLTAVPKVLIERWSVLEHRVTYSSQYQEIFALTREEQDNQRLRALDPAAFAEDPVPVAYWYAIGRDTDMEKRLAENVQDRVR